MKEERKRESGSEKRKRWRERERKRESGSEKRKRWGERERERKRDYLTTKV